ncbi:hypothetical protein COEREDRAFT_10162 [Coemansia reversa NRRL 1564]|uniref:Uncharacterized protein n=1 Tax=Coemansia reversa (strain ATCC 12441 / NRRL 1564) TaxID=763665 RepID=A0A2G5B6E7_COERN|nr:hypothetical protein COEREDRAFT_10162 [Coemansia reversa NRRL 1564]|eukprot:PIA14570.1 hypothetical protein COEREDRAFT_10162 [Coemansia reversa NRRL 1564]
MSNQHTTEQHQNQPSHIVTAEERERNTAAYAQGHKNPNQRAAEQAADTSAQRQKHANPAQQQAADTLAHQQRRTDSDYHAQEQAANTLAHQQRCTDASFRAQKQAADTIAHWQRHTDASFCTQEQAADTIAHRQAYANQQHIPWEQAAQAFHRIISSGPDNVCNCYGRLWFSKSVTTKSHEDFAARNAPDGVISNAFQVNPDADEAKTEEQLVAVRHVFQTIRQVHGANGQYSSIGAIVNVLVEIDTTAHGITLSKTFIDEQNLVETSENGATETTILQDEIDNNINNSIQMLDNDNNGDSSDSDSDSDSSGSSSDSGHQLTHANADRP